MNRILIIKDFIFESDFEMDDISVKRENAALNARRGAFVPSACSTHLREFEF